jgi:endonuclease-3|tara:strand:+ start:1548 stop:2183 length:636 start_codon:yes stop_codon:yes gene_type:complete
MTNKERAAKILSILEREFPEVPIPLYHKDPYTLLIAVLLSAQCTDERVNKITPLLFAKADNPYDMVKMTVEEIKEIIRPCGLSPMKSKGIHGLSQMIIEQHGGEVPQSFEALEAMPAVGHKTASVVMSQAFGVSAFPVDTHIHRLAYRWKLSTGKNVDKTEKDLKAAFPIDTWNKVHLQIIFFGRKYCPARGHNALACPICKDFGRASLFK